jgi:hypothetical protein
LNSIIESPCGLQVGVGITRKKLNLKMILNVRIKIQQPPREHLAAVLV